MNDESPADFQALMSQRLEAQGLSSADMGRVADAVSSIWEHRDELLDVVDWFKDHKDSVMDLLSKLPDLVSSAGSGIANAGEAAVSAAKFLVGGDGDDEFSASDLARTAADALDRCREELADAQDLIRRLGDEVDEITVPSVKPKFVKIAGLNVIAGLDIGQSNLADDAANKIRGGADRLAGVGEGLETVSDQLRKLGGAVTEAGGKLQSVGGFLETSGTQLSGLTSMLQQPVAQRAAVAADRSAADLDLGAIPSPSLSKAPKTGSATPRPRKSPAVKAAAGAAKPSATKSSAAKPAPRSSRKKPPL